MNNDSSARSHVEAKAVWEAEGKFYTLRLKGMGRVEMDRDEDELLYSSELFYKSVIPSQERYRFVVDIEDTFTIQETEEDPRARRASTSIDVISLESLKSAMELKNIPEDASIEIDPFDGGNLVTFKWKAEL